MDATIWVCFLGRNPINVSISLEESRLYLVRKSKWLNDKQCDILFSEGIFDNGDDYVFSINKYEKVEKCS